MTETKRHPLVHAAPPEGSRKMPCCDTFEHYLADDNEHGDTLTIDPGAVTCRPATHHRDGERYSFTLAELQAMAAERFGPDPRAWAFECSNCGDVATPADFMAAGAEIDRCGQECIGRTCRTRTGDDPQGRPWASRGCNWAAYGLFPGPWKIAMPASEDGEEVKPLRSFRLAPAPTSGDANSPE